MNELRRLINSISKLVWVLIREGGFALQCLATGKFNDARDHIRVALQVLHEDCSAFAGKMAANARCVESSDPPRIMIIKLDRVGDMVNTTPVFDILRKKFPEAKIDLVGHPTVLTMLEDDLRIAERIPYVSPLYHPGTLKLPTLDDLKLVYRLRKRNYRAIIYLRGTFLFLPLSTRGKFFPSKFSESEPVIRRYLRAFCSEGELEGPLPLPSLTVSEVSRKRVLEKYPNIEGRRRVVIHSVSAAEGKQWPLERFARVADGLVTRAKVNVLFLAAPVEKDKLDRVAELCKYQHDYETGFRLSEVVAAIAEADVFIGNDSGLSHIAAAVRTREVVIWGAANLSMARPVALQNYCTILYHDVPCRAICREEHCVAKNYLRCLLETNESEVVEAALVHLRASKVT